MVRYLSRVSRPDQPGIDQRAGSGKGGSGVLYRGYLDGESEEGAVVEGGLIRFT